MLFWRKREKEREFKKERGEAGSNCCCTCCRLSKSINKRKAGEKPKLNQLSLFSLSSLRVSS